MLLACLCFRIKRNRYMAFIYQRACSRGQRHFTVESQQKALQDKQILGCYQLKSFIFLPLRKLHILNAPASRHPLWAVHRYPAISLKGSANRQSCWLSKIVLLLLIVNATVMLKLGQTLIMPLSWEWKERTLQRILQNAISHGPLTSIYCLAQLSVAHSGP